MKVTALAFPWLPVESSNLKRVRYTRGRLEVEFHRGGTYRYEGVPLQLVLNMLDAPSLGEFFAAHVRYAFPYTKVVDGDTNSGPQQGPTHDGGDAAAKG